MEKLEPLYISGKNIKWWNCFKKLNAKITIWSNNSNPRYVNKITKAETPTDNYKPVLTEELFIVAKSWTQPKYSSADLKDKQNTYIYNEILGFPGGQTVKNLPAMWKTWVWSLGWEDPLRRAWQPIPVFLPGESLWTQEPAGLQSMGLQRIRHNWVTKHSTMKCYSSTKRNKILTHATAMMNLKKSC